MNFYLMNDLRRAADGMLELVSPAVLVRFGVPFFLPQHGRPFLEFLSSGVSSAYR